jgi:acyl carrier protein
MNHQLTEQVRTIVLQHGRFGAALSALQDDADLYALGMTSHASVGVMLALEAEFDLEFPDRLLTRQVFESVRSIACAVSELIGVDAPRAQVS